MCNSIHQELNVKSIVNELIQNVVHEIQKNLLMV